VSAVISDMSWSSALMPQPRLMSDAGGMARLPRPDLAGVPQHVVQRGNNRFPCFLDDEDRRRYLQCLYEALRRYGCDLHAYVLMDNHAHLLVTPQDVGAVSRLMQTFGRNYAGLFNGRHGRTGTLWEGRYKSCLVDTERYVLTCSRYIELNPVRARMVVDPAEYPWSSYHANALGRPDLLVTPSPTLLALAGDPAARATAYRALFDEALPDDVIAEIRLYLQQQRALGTDRFRAQVEAKLKRFSGARPAHRPRKQPVKAAR
jgi:putative transposase